LIGVNVNVMANVNGHEPKELKEVMDKEKLNWRSFADQGDIVRKWNMPFTPTFYVIDHKGAIRHKWVGSPGEKAIDTALEKLIQEAEGNAKK
jgi:peroxiredoxin